jgi:hypothetical protein
MMELYRRDNTDSMFYFGIPLAERGRVWQRLRGAATAAGPEKRLRSKQLQTLCIISN